MKLQTNDQKTRPQPLRSPEPQAALLPQPTTHPHDVSACGRLRSSGEGERGAKWLGTEPVSEYVLVAAMPGNRRTDAISTRDLEVLGFIARFGVIPREVVASWAGTGRAVSAARERRLGVAGLIEVAPGIGDSGRLVSVTRSGLRSIAREDLPVPRLSYDTLAHSTVLARVAVELEHAGHCVLSERELLARERIEGKRIYSAEQIRGGYHRPDLVLLGDPPTAIEVELTAKAPYRLDRLLRSWRRAVAAKQFGHVRYLCSADALGALERSARRTRTAEVVAVERIDESKIPGPYIR